MNTACFNSRGSSCFAFVLGLGLLLAPQACSAQGKLPAHSLSVLLFRQATSYSCGATVLQAVLVYWGTFDGKESEYENRHGVRREYHQAAIFIHGKKAATPYPQPPTRLE